MENNFLLLDGAMGTMIQRKGIAVGQRPEILNLLEPEKITEIHQEYIDAGSDIFCTNTFGANRLKLEGTGHGVEEVVLAACQNAKRARDARHQLGRTITIACNIGPLGEMMEPNGTLTFETAYSCFEDLVLAARDHVDMFIIETMTDLFEMKAAILAIKEHSNLPIFASMSYEEDGRTFTGVAPANFATLASRLGVDALGANCSVGPEKMFYIIREMAEVTNTPILVKANAGLPDPETGKYNLDASTFAHKMLPIADLGVKYIGGCCGTGPEYIAEIKKALQGRTSHRDPVPLRPHLSSSTATYHLDRPILAGETLNATENKRFLQAIEDKDFPYVMKEAVLEAEAGAAVLDLNLGAPGIDQKATFPQLVRAIQSISDAVLMIDTTDPQAMEAAIRVYNGCPILNSTTATPKSMDAIFPLAQKYGASVVVLTCGEKMPQSATERIQAAETAIKAAQAYGLGLDRLIFDCLTFTASSDQEEIQSTLEAMRTLKAKYQDIKLTLGVSNVSYGLPQRGLLNATFLTLALGAGLDLPIVNPANPHIRDQWEAYQVLANLDPGAKRFLARQAARQKAKAKTKAKGSEDHSGQQGPEFHDESTGTQAHSQEDSSAPGVPSTAAMTAAIDKGLKEEAKRLTRQLLATQDSLTIIEQYLIPALDYVSDKYDRKEIFLPQLISASNAAQEAFEVIKTTMAEAGKETISKGSIVFATVKGDIHDIGKNIVRVIVDNYGYTTIDLGKDVPPEVIVDTVVREKIKLVGLSTLMTTTLPSMEETIQKLKAASPDTKIIVGGAVLTPSFAKKMGADYYAKDASASVAIAREVFGD